MAFWWPSGYRTSTSLIWFLSRDISCMSHCTQTIGTTGMSQASTYFGSLFEQSNDCWSVSAADRSVKGTHPTAIHMLHGRAMIHQILHLAQETFSMIYWYNKGFVFRYVFKKGRSEQLSLLFLSINTTKNSNESLLSLEYAQAYYDVLHRHR